VKETSRSVSEKKIVIREPYAAVTYLIEALRHTDASDSTATPPSSVRASAAHAPVRHCGRPRPALWALLQCILRPPARRRSRPRPAPPSAPPPSSWTRSCNAPCRLPPRVRIRPSASIRSRSGSSHGPWRLGIGEKTEASLNSTVWDRNKSTPPDHRPLRFYNPPLANNHPTMLWTLCTTPTLPTYEITHPAFHPRFLPDFRPHLPLVHLQPPYTGKATYQNKSRQRTDTRVNKADGSTVFCSGLQGRPGIHPP
jgi:hypothetical protein